MDKMMKNVDNVNEKGLLLTRAQGAVLSRDFVTAARLYKQLLTDDPSNVDYLKELGSIYVKNNEDKKAIPYYEQIITFYPHYIDAMNSLGAIYRRLKRYDESIAILQKALDEGRQVPSVNYNLGFTYKEMGNYDDAIDAFQSVITANPTDVLAHNHLGSIYLAKKEYEKSINAFKRGLQIDQNHPILNYNLARCFQEAKQYNDAIRCYETALKAKPGWIEPIRDFSDLLIQCQKTKEASDIVRNSIQLHPHDAKLLCTMGQIYLNEYDYESAEKTFKKANAIDSQNVKILSYLAESLERDEKPLDALDAVEKALQIEPENKDIKKQYVKTLLSAGEFDSANQNVLNLYKDNGSRDPQVLDLCGQYCICVEKDDKAQQYYKKIKLVNRHYNEHLLSAAGRYSQIGKNDIAEQYAKDYVSKDESNPAGYNMLGKIYTRAGKIKEAITSFLKSKELRKPNVMADKQITKLQKKIDEIPVETEPVELPKEEEVVMPQTAPVEQHEEQEEEEFDFGTMGDNIPMGEALLEEEKDFFEQLDEATGEAEEAEDFFEEDKSEPVQENAVTKGTDPLASEMPESSYVPDSSSPSDSFMPQESNGPDLSDLQHEENVSPFSDFDKDQQKSQAQQLVPNADFSEKDEQEKTPEEELSNFLDDIDSDDNFDFDQFDDSFASEEDEKQNEPVNYSSDTPGDYPSYTPNDFRGPNDGYQGSPVNNDVPDSDYVPQDNNDYSQSNPYQQSAPSSQNNPPVQDNNPVQNSQPFAQTQPQSGFDPNMFQAQSNAFAQEMARSMQNAMMDSARYAMDAAMNAQKLAQSLSDEQEKLKEQLKEVKDKSQMNKEMPQSVQDSLESFDEIPDITEDIPDFENNTPDVTNEIPDVEESLPDFTENIPETTDDMSDIVTDIPEVTDDMSDVVTDIPEVSQPLDDETIDLSEFGMDDQIDSADFENEELPAEDEYLTDGDRYADDLPEVLPAEDAIAEESISDKSKFINDFDLENIGLPDEQDMMAEDIMSASILSEEEQVDDSMNLPEHLEEQEVEDVDDFTMADPDCILEESDNILSDDNVLNQTFEDDNTLEETNFDEQFDSLNINDFESQNGEDIIDSSNFNEDLDAVADSLEAELNKPEITEEDIEKEIGSDNIDSLTGDKDFDFVLDEFDDSFLDLDDITNITQDEFLNVDDFEFDENLAEIDLFKKLLSLCEFLPEDKKEDFMYGKQRMQMEYLISRLSGKPGLLRTILSASKQTDISNTEEAVENNDNQIRQVFETMKKLSQSLEDTYLSKALCNCVDEILAKI